MEDPHVETKSQGGKPLKDREKNPHAKRRAEIQANGSEWVVVTEVRMKYELQSPDGPQTFEFYVDPCKLNSIHFDPRECDLTRKAIEPGKKHVQLSPDGANGGWE